MAGRQAPLLAVHPSGYPRALVVGRSIVLGVFIPPFTGTVGSGKSKQELVEEIVAKERPRARVIPGKKPIPQLYTPAKTAAWEEHVAKEALAQLRGVEVEGDKDFTLPIRDCRVLATVRFNLRKPVSYPKSVVHAVKKPDLDNLVKAIWDGLVNAQVLEDDNCITDTLMMKRYADAEHPPGVEVELTCLPL